MSDQTADPVDLDEQYTEPELFLGPNGRYGVRVGSQFSYKGNPHWARVTVEDNPLIEQDDDGNVTGYEDPESLIYRVDEIAHRSLAAQIARMKYDIDSRSAADMAARVAKATAEAENRPS